MRRTFILIGLLLALSLATVSASNHLIPIDLDTGESYQGLPIQLVNTGEPTVTPSGRGKIGVVCIGMSNTKQICRRWRGNMRAGWADDVNPAVVIANCAKGGKPIEVWAASNGLWQNCLDRRLNGRRGKPVADDIKVVVLHARRREAGLPMYPDPASDYYRLMINLDDATAKARQFFPNLQAIYVIPGINASFKNYEPEVYEMGHAINTWLAANPTINGVSNHWGGYLWAGVCPSGVNGSGVCWEQSDYEADNIHPSNKGEQKAAEMIHAGFMDEAWFRR